MDTCNRCGEPIEFRYIGGAVTPIHLSGGWCDGASRGGSSLRPFRDIEGYTNPNAFCPVCGEKVFFYQSPSGGRVFFDDLGWPWPKHPCTDNGTHVTPSTAVLRGPIAVVDRSDHTLHVYDLDDLIETDAFYFFTFRNLQRGTRLKAMFGKKSLKKGDVLIDDLHDAPSFLIRRAGDPPTSCRVEFISVRRRKILRLEMRLLI